MIAEVLLFLCRSLARFLVEYSTSSLLCTLVCWSGCIVGIVAFFAHGAEIGVVAGTHVLSFRVALEDKSRWDNWVNGIRLNRVSWLIFDKISLRPLDVSNAEYWIHASFMVLNTAEVGRVFECHVRNLEVSGLKQIPQGSKVCCGTSHPVINHSALLVDYHPNVSKVAFVPG